jgi:hypothetical protein
MIHFFSPFSSLDQKADPWPAAKADGAELTVLAER